MKDHSKQQEDDDASPVSGMGENAMDT